MNKYLLLPLVFLMTFSPASFGHHSISPYDSTRRHEVEGVVTKQNWRNPHAKFEISVTNSEGGTESWDIEADAVNTLIRRGLKREDMAVGQTLRFYGRPSSRGRNELFALIC